MLAQDDRTKYKIIYDELHEANTLIFAPLSSVIKSINYKQNYSKCLEEIKIRGVFIAWMDSYISYKTLVVTGDITCTKYKLQPNCNARLLTTIKYSINLRVIFSSVWTLCFDQFKVLHRIALNKEYWKVAVYLYNLGNAARTKTLLKNEIFQLCHDID